MMRFAEAVSSEGRVRLLLRAGSFECSGHLIEPLEEPRCCDDKARPSFECLVDPPESSPWSSMVLTRRTATYWDGCNGCARIGPGSCSWSL